MNYQPAAQQQLPAGRPAVVIRAPVVHRHTGREQVLAAVQAAAAAGRPAPKGGGASVQQVGRVPAGRGQGAGGQGAGGQGAGGQGAAVGRAPVGWAPAPEAPHAASPISRLRPCRLNFTNIQR